MLKQAQRLLVPERVNEWLDLGKNPFAGAMINLYKFARVVRLQSVLKAAILPSGYKKEVAALDAPISGRSG